MARKKIRSDKEKLIQRLRRIEGQTAALVRMAQQDAYCIDLLTQMAAARAALLAAAQVILTDHLRSCVVNSFQKGRSQTAIKELEAVLTQFVK
ncbi:MAG: hypothetical protein AMJ79_11430 [Phycisphaerae bacterium SM23_30]|nr:MAG: hypothetical protein AMJ79_11430 [Phycisphaerae bacterium SM23_30]